MIVGPSGAPFDLLEDIGAEVDNKPGNRVGVKLNGHSAALSLKV